MKDRLIQLIEQAFDQSVKEEFEQTRKNALGTSVETAAQQFWTGYKILSEFRARIIADIGVKITGE
jgi:sensor domain CHASE-containing protein